NCGRTIRVPRLSELRVSKGMDASESNIRDTIARMIREGSLPWEHSCAVTGVQTDDVMLFDVQCERSYVKGKTSKRWGTILLVLGFFACLPVAIFMWLIGSDLFKTSVERVGRNVVVTIPLRVSNDSQAAVKRSSQARLKKMLLDQQLNMLFHSPFGLVKTVLNRMSYTRKALELGRVKAKVIRFARGLDDKRIR